MEDDSNKIAQSLSKIPLFFGLEPDELKTVLALCKSESFSEGETIIKEGDPSHCMYIMLSGEIEITTQKSGTIVYLSSCDIFGEIGLITQRTRSASAIAKTECTLLRIDHVGFNFLAGKNPRVSALLMRNISTNLANHVVRMNNAPLEHIPHAKQQPKDAQSQVLINTPK